MDDALLLEEDQNYRMEEVVMHRNGRIILLDEWLLVEDLEGQKGLLYDCKLQPDEQGMSMYLEVGEGGESLGFLEVIAMLMLAQKVRDFLDPKCMPHAQ